MEGDHALIIYDIEIENAIPSDREVQLSDIKYCAGWKDFEGMGISCIGAYDYASDRTRIFCKDNLDEFESLIEKSECLISFNGNRFDIPLLAASGIIVPPNKSYDLLEEIWRAVGAPTEGFTDMHRGFSLGQMSETNFRGYKTAHGGLAPINWQRGKIGNVIDYCLNDVWLTKRLTDKVIRTGWLVSPKDGSPLQLRKPHSGDIVCLGD
jgi:hypothetical protein